MQGLTHLPTAMAASFSDAVKIPMAGGSWIFISGQLGVSDQGSASFEEEVRTIFDRMRSSLEKLGAEMRHVVSIKAYLTDLAPYAIYSRVRGEVFPQKPPTSTAVQVAGLLRGATIEIDAIAFLPTTP
jgi:2-iminobutanoate/2-iminopropanoate deaminase